MSATVVGVAVARDQSVGFERVQQRDKDARVDAHRLLELPLWQSPVVVQQSQDLELARLEVVGRVRCPQSTHRLVADEREQEAGAGAVLFEDAGRGGLHLRRHYISLSMVEVAISLCTHHVTIKEIRMRAIALNSPDTAPALRDDLPSPAPADNEVLVRVHASSVNPVDNSIAAGMLAKMGLEYEYPVVLGRDYAGVIDQVGEAVSNYKTSDHVFGFLLHANPNVGHGAWAEQITVTEEISIAPVPDGVDLATAGAAPLAGITALALVDALEVSEGDVVLVAGATGGVGSLAVQLAARAG